MPRWRSWPGPRLVLLDEPAGGVNLTMLANLRDRLEAINREGATFVVIEHNMEFVMSLCSRIVVLAEGRIIARGESGRRAARSQSHRGVSWPLTILTLEEVVAGYGKMTILHGTSFSVARGAITTVIGPNGAGKSTVFKTVFGMLPARSGRVLFEGADITNRRRAICSRAASPTCRRAATSFPSSRCGTIWSLAP